MIEFLRTWWCKRFHKLEPWTDYWGYGQACWKCRWVYVEATTDPDETK